MLYRPPNHGILTPYPWYIDPTTHGILNPLPMVYRTPPHGISTPPYPWYFDPPVYLSIRNEGGQNTMGVQFTIQGRSVFNKEGQYTMGENRPRGQLTMGVKIPYDTGKPCHIMLY